MQCAIRTGDRLVALILVRVEHLAQPALRQPEAKIGETLARLNAVKAYEYLALARCNCIGRNDGDDRRHERRAIDGNDFRHAPVVPGDAAVA